MITGWIIGVVPTVAAAVHTQIDARPDNPSKAEVRRRGRRARRARGQERVTPRLALLPDGAGAVDVGIPDDGWSTAAVLGVRPGAVVVLERDHPEASPDQGGARPRNPSAR